MRTGRASLAMLFSFQELAWLSVCAVMLFHAVASGKSKKENQRLSDDYNASQTDLAKAIKARAALDNELESKREMIHTKAEMERQRRDLTDAQKQLAESKGKEGTQRNRADGLARQLAALSARMPSPTATPTAAPKLTPPVADEPSIRRELLGLKGELKNVAFVFDRSGSMGPRWDAACELVRTWIEYLDIEACVLITFNQAPEMFPQDGTLWQMTDESGTPLRANRENLRSRLKGIKPEGGTNTLAALEMAYACPDIDTIILFTDGHPQRTPVRKAVTLPARRSVLPFFAPPKPAATPIPAAIDAAELRAIYEFCGRQALLRTKPLPVNTVGLGEYFKDKEFTTFLLTVAKITKGTFIGR